MINKNNDQFNILIVDDDHTNLTVLRKMLASHGYRVRPALSGELALQAAETETPDLVLLDIMMPPGIDGFETCQKLRSLPGLQDIPILFISALDSIEDINKAFEVGGQDYITKPFHEKEVTARIKVHLNLLISRRNLEYQEQQTRLITDNSPAFIIYVDASDFTIKFVNRKFEEVLGHPRETFYGQHISVAFTEKTNLAAASHLAKVKQGQEASFEYDVEINDQTLWIKVDCVPDYDKDGNVRGIVALGHDITWEKELEKLRQSMIADVSHELRTPLAVLQAKVEAIQDGIRPCDKEQMGLLHKGIINLSRLIDDLFELSLSDSRAITFHKEKVDITTLLNKNVELYSNLYIKKSISFSASIPKEVNVYADVSRLNQVFANLFNNSYFYTDEDGSASIEVNVTPSNVTIQLEDSAPGVPDADLENIFTRFYRVDKSRNRAHGGAGLGLALCRTIIEEHEGTITANHSPQGGVSITVILPLLKNDTD